MSAKMAIEKSGLVATLETSFAKGCSLKAPVVQVVYPASGYFVHQNKVFYDAGDAGALRRLLKKVEETPVCRGTETHPLGEALEDRAWLTAGGPSREAWRDSAPGGMLAHVSEQDGMPKCAEFFRGGFRNDGSHKNVYMFRYRAEKGHHNKMHPDHGATTQDQLSNLRAHAKVSGYQRVLLKCAEAGCRCYFCVRSSVESEDSTEGRDIVVYELPADRATAIICCGDDLDVTLHGMGGVLEGETNWTVIADVLGKCGLDAVVELEAALQEKQESSPELRKMDVHAERSLQQQHRLFQSGYRARMLSPPVSLSPFRMHTFHGQTLPIFPELFGNRFSKKFGLSLERGGRGSSVGWEVGLDTSGWSFNNSYRLYIEYRFDSTAAGNPTPIFTPCRPGGFDQTSTEPRTYRVTSTDAEILEHLTNVGCRLLACEPMRTVGCATDEELRCEVQQHLACARGTTNSIH